MLAARAALAGPRPDLSLSNASCGQPSPVAHGAALPPTCPLGGLALASVSACAHSRRLHTLRHTPRILRKGLSGFISRSLRPRFAPGLRGLSPSASASASSLSVSSCRSALSTLKENQRETCASTCALYGVLHLRMCLFRPRAMRSLHANTPKPRPSTILGRRMHHASRRGAAVARHTSPPCWSPAAASWPHAISIT